MVIIENTKNNNIDYRDDARWKVYVYTNKVNGKKYVGQTCRSLKERAGKDGKLYRQCTAFSAAIKKYGWDNFEPEIVADHLTRKEANDFEKVLISKLNTQSNKYGYNISSGGGDNTFSSIDITGQKFGRWTALYLVDTPEGATGRHWMCRCDCGTIKVIRQDHLSNGTSKSCGCLSREINSKITKNEIIQIGNKIIVLMSNNYSFIVDEETYNTKIHKYHWYYDVSNKRIVTGKDSCNIYNIIFDMIFRKKMYSYIKHKNSNMFDFRKENLQINIPDYVQESDWLLYLSNNAIGISYLNMENKKWLVRKNVVDKKQHSFFTLKDAIDFISNSKKGVS